MYVIGTAGHVDHGKSLLVQTLTGIDPDRLREEKTRGMTIDLGFAWLMLPSARTVSIVDVPGHERFIKNMLAGAGGIDLALLVVAADDGVMPQTREHLAILDLLGVSRGVVALTKRDLVDDSWAALVAGDIAEILGGTSLEGSPIVHCSSRAGTGLEELLDALDAAVANLPPKRDVGRPRLPIDRVFTVDGFGTVVTGTLVDGELAIGDEVEVVPGGAMARIRGLQTHKHKVERAQPGTRTAVNLAGIDRASLRRGLVVARPGDVVATRVLDARVRALNDIAHPLRHNTHVTFHCGSDEANARVRLLEANELRPGEEAWAQIKLETPVAVLRGDRFVLRTPDDTVAGGTVHDIAAKRHRRNHASTIAVLESLASDDPKRALIDAITGTPLIPAGQLRGAANGNQVDDAMLDALVTSGQVVRVGEGATARYATAAWLSASRDRVVRAVAEYHRRHPLRPGVPIDEIRTLLAADTAGTAALFGSIAEVAVSGTTVAAVGFTRAPSAAEQSAIDAFRAELKRAPVAGPPSHMGRELLGYLIDTGVVIDAGGVFFEADTFASMQEQVRARIAQQGAISLAQARDLLGTNRRVAQALLEHLDRLRVTRRVGEERVLR